LSRRPNRTLPVQRYKGGAPVYRRPFWLPASNYYVLSIALTVAFFFLVWGVLHDGTADAPWIPAGISASLLLCCAVFLREVVLRRARRRYIAAQRRLDDSLTWRVLAAERSRNPNKLTLEKNAAILNDIVQKSDAAKVLSKLSDGHWEVFEMCGEYLTVSSNELKIVAVGSPRLAALHRGREKIRELHRYHLLRWAEIEARSLTQDARNRAKIVIGSALEFYPEESSLLESEEALKEFVASIKISHWIERAERAAFKNNYKQALSLYRDALFYLGRENVKSEEKRLIAERINAEIEKIRALEN
jgi:hypothetical protein